MRIAITGGSGSLGRALIRKLTRDALADRIVAFSRDEQKRAALAAEFKHYGGMRVYAGDVRDPVSRLAAMFRGCDVVVHAAARKVVTAHPDEAEEMLRTNVLGTQNVIEAAADAQVRKLLFISSDKAVAAENVYGVSKAMAEHLVVNYNARAYPTGMRLGVLRYGNVLASRGSVVQVWRAKMEAGERLEVSDPRMTRFWLTLPQAVDYVLEAVAKMRGGEVFVPHVPAAPLTTLLEATYDGGGMFDPNTMKITGIRQGGEKLHEELLSASEVRRVRRLNGLYVVPPFQNDDMWDNGAWPGTDVDRAMVYRSDVWPWQMTVAEMRQLLKEA